MSFRQCICKQRKLPEMSTNDDFHKNLYLQLMQESRILHLVYHRNKNQHQRTHWWKRVNVLKRNCQQVSKLLVGRKIQKLDELTHLYHLLNGFIKKQLKRTYREFNSIIALGQFVTLGVVLVGILARVYAVYGKLLEIYEPQFRDAGFMRVPSKEPRESKQFLESLIEEELGDPLPSEPDKTVPLERPAAKAPSFGDTRTKKSSKKKKKSAIDNIFG